MPALKYSTAVLPENNKITCSLHFKTILNETKESMTLWKEPQLACMGSSMSTSE